MTRMKVKMAFIENESARKSTFKKRKRGILKKAQELSTLCDVPVCVLIDSSFDSNTEVWPSREEANTVVSQWKMLSVTDMTRKMLNQETFLQQRISKATESWKKLWKQNKESEMKEIMFDCVKGETSVSRIEKSDLRNLGCVVEQYLKDLDRRIEILRRNNESSSSSANAAATNASNVMPIAEMGSSSGGFYDKIREKIENDLSVKHSIKGFDLNQKQDDV